MIRGNNETQGATPFDPAFGELMPLKDFLEKIALEFWKGRQVNQPGAIFWAPDGQGDGCQVFGTHDPDPVILPFMTNRLLKCLGLKTRACTQKLNRKPVKEDWSSYPN